MFCFFLPIGIEFQINWNLEKTCDIRAINGNLLAECANIYTKYNAVRNTANIDDDRECELEKT